MCLPPSKQLSYALSHGFTVMAGGGELAGLVSGQDLKGKI
jgi:hypothetical protein